MYTKLTITFLSLFFFGSVQSQEPELLNGRSYFKQANTWYLLDVEGQQLIEVLSDEITLKLNTQNETADLDFLSSEYDLQLVRKSSVGWYDFSLTNDNYSQLITYCNQLQTLAIVDEVDVATPIDFMIHANDSAYFDTQTQTYHQWNLLNTKVNTAWNKTTGSNDIVLAIIRLWYGLATRRFCTSYRYYGQQ